jgi:hypothetical protein
VRPVPTGGKADDRYPKIAQEDWKPRERARKLLRNILSRQAEACEAQRKVLLKESLAGPSPYDFAAEIAPSHADALLMRRTQVANMREIRRLINLLLKIKCHERQMEAPEKTAPLHDVSETNGVSSLESECPKIYLIQTKIVRLNDGDRGEKTGAALHDVIETKGISNDERKLRKNRYY